MAYSQKIEKRRLGTVGGIHGTLTWTANNIQEPEAFSYLLLEQENTVDSSDLNLEVHPFALSRGVKFLIEPRNGDLTEDIFSIAEAVDNAFKPFLPKVQRSMSCKECRLLGIPGYFPASEGFQLEKVIQRCSEGEHSFDAKLAKLMKKKQEPFKLNNLLKVDKSQLDLKAFEDSAIKKDMLSGKLEAGEQIWIYHDGQTNPCNLIARFNCYAHVVIYLGQTNETHEVVHIASAPLTRGLMKAKIRKQNVMEVIKPRDLVFLGHKIPNCQISANLRKEIVKRALKSVDKPSIVFDYHYRYNIVERL